MEQTTGTTEPILETRNVSKAFGAVQAVKKVNWKVNPGEVTALVGDKVAGKSRLIKLGSIIVSVIPTVPVIK